MNYIILLTFLLSGCSDSITDSQKRNSKWVWSTDLNLGNGQWVPVGNQNNVQDGLITTFYDNGNKYYESFVFDNKMTDTTKYFDFKSSDKLIKIHIKNNNKEEWFFPVNGVFEQYYQDGSIHEKGFVSNHYYGYVWLVYNTNGVITFKEHRDTLSNIRSYANYYSNGKLKDSSTYKNGIPHGPSKIWFKNGQLKESTAWKNGKEHGELREYYSQGTIKSIWFFNNGKPDGKMEDYFPNTLLKGTVTFNNGIKEGPMMTNYESGIKKFNGEIIKGQINGNWFYSTGELFAHSELITPEEMKIVYFTKKNQPFVSELVTNGIVVLTDTLLNIELTFDEKNRFENRRKN